MERPVFAESATQMLHVASQGIPRVINQICGQALFDAEGKGLEVVEEEHIGRVLADMTGNGDGEVTRGFLIPVMFDVKLLTGLTCLPRKCDKEDRDGQNDADLEINPQRILTPLDESS